MRDHAREFPVNLMCRVLDAPRSGFYAWLDSPESARTRSNRQLLVRIKAVHAESRRAYGSPRIRKALREDGKGPSRRRIARLMKENGIRSVHPRKFRVTTDSSHKSPLAPNLLQRDFTATAPNQKWVADITYVWTDEGWLYLAAVLDLYSRRIVGYSLERHLGTELVLNALRMAMDRRQPGPGLLHHSDRGSQYADAVYRAALERWSATCSMSRRGNCWDNAVMESFFKSLKVERIYQTRYATRREARLDIIQWIESFYNSKRIHSALGDVSPAEFEQRARAAQHGVQLAGATPVPQHVVVLQP
jgi:putative transposase